MEADIAIIGMACRVAGAKSPTELWENLVSSKDVQRRITRFNIDGFYHPACGSEKGLTYVDRAYMLDDDAVDKFDNAFFHITPTEATAIDPQYRMLLEVSYEAIENAGIPLEIFSGTDTAVFTGIEGSDYHTVMARDPDVTPEYIVTGTAGCMAANRLSYFYNLSGPSAVRALQHGDSVMALVCGANLIFNPDSFVTMSKLGFLSASGRCRSFDADAGGYGRGEGIGVLVLKQLKKAIEDDDPIRAVIKGTRLNQDGRTQGITLPSAKAQQQNMRGLYKESAVDPSTIQYLEAHGTGTAAGDTVEMQAINDCYVSNPLYVGSIKSNIGHCEATSGLAGVIKTVMCLENAQIPAQMHFENPNPAINFVDRTVPTGLLDWPNTGGGVRRAAINTFGAGGTNGHAILEAYTTTSKIPKPCNERKSWLFKISAADEASLQALATSYASYVQLCTPDLRDLAHTLTARRADLKYSRFMVASNHEALCKQLDSAAGKVILRTNSRVKKTLFVFTGQGAQWARMGNALIGQSPVFRSVLQECDAILRALPDGPSWSIIEELSKGKDESNIDKAEYSQPLCTALQIAIVSLLRSWNTTPDLIVGHSSGEICAAFAAGMITMRDAIVAAYYRGYVFARSSLSTPEKEAKGSMCAVGMGEEQCLDLLHGLGDRVQLAAHLLEEARVSHSNEDQRCPMFSSVTGSVLQPNDLNPAYWARNMTSTVRFASALEECIHQYPEINSIVDVGPHSALKGPTSEILHSQGRHDVHYFGTCKRDTDDFHSILESTGDMIAAGMPLDIRALNATEAFCGGIWQHEYGKVLTDLPSYQWNHSSPFWFESRVSRNIRFRAFPRHEFLGSRYVDDIPSRACWRNTLDVKELRWIEGLEPDELPGISCAVMISMAVEAAQQLWTSAMSNDSVVQFLNVKILRSLPLVAGIDKPEQLEIQFISRIEEAPARMSFEIYCSSADASKGRDLCSAGTLELHWKISSVASDDLREAAPDDLILRQKVQVIYPWLSQRFETLKLNNGKIHGNTSRKPKSMNHSSIHPATLGAILSLGPISLIDQNLPVSYRIEAIEKLQVSINVGDPSSTQFDITTRPTQASEAISKIVITGGADNIITARIRYTATELIPPRPTTSSLFFKPVCLPDITKQMDTSELSIQNLVQSLTHKWPMCDIAIGDVPAEAQGRILHTLNAGHRFRSVTVCRKDQTEMNSDRIHIVEELPSSLEAHIIFTSQTSSTKILGENLKAGGLACISGTVGQLGQQFSDSYTCIGAVSSLDEAVWSLWRKKSTVNPSSSKWQRFVFSNERTSLEGEDHICLQPSHIKSFIAQHQDGHFNAVIIDHPKTSIILDWPGQQLIPWLRYLMNHAESILWVTSDISSGPHVNVAGTLLRTLQAEQPSLKVCWLAMGEAEMEGAAFAGKVNDAYESMLQGDNEIRGESGIIRYISDEDLSLATGVTLPRQIQDPLGYRDYALALAAPNEPAVLSYDCDIPTASNCQCMDISEALLDHPGREDTKRDVQRVKVVIKASLISCDDLVAYKGASTDHQCKSDEDLATSQALGTFFFGNVATSATPKFNEESSVIGWANGANAKIVDVPESNLYPVNSENHPRALAEFASLATAMAVLDGHIRARKEDCLEFVNIDGMLEEAFSLVCEELQLAVLDCRRPNSPTFKIELSDLNEILVNGVPVNRVTKYLATQPPAFAHLLNTYKPFTSTPNTFPFASHKEAFAFATASSNPTILIHNNIPNIPHVPIYRPQTHLASPNGAYIIIGGLGGLGRYVCSWLITQGATSIYAISRSGLSSPSAQELHSTLNSLPHISFRIIKADACNRALISYHLSSIRSRETIKGVVNMAMVLGDAPLASMTGEEWDRALR
ncbi:MAG: hypothetical protein Q9170_006352, partial [Blastenia crenularia]